MGGIHAKATKKTVWAKLDGYILSYFLPILFVLTGAQFDTEAAMANLKIIGIMTMSTFLSLGLAALIAGRFEALASPEMRKGFIILAVCANTGHGLMLLTAGTPDPSIMQLAGGAFYQGFLVVVILPQLLAGEQGQRAGTIMKMILYHPVSYSCLFGFGLAVHPAISGGAFTLLAVRILINKKKDKEWTLCDPKPLVALGITAALCYGFLDQVNPTQWFSLGVTFITAITIGDKMVNQKMQEGHWRIVFAIMAFGIIIAPFAVVLPLAWVTSCSYPEAYVLAYMVSQPPAYLGMVWLRQGKFGELPIGEWAFSLQAIAAYILAIAFPDLLKLWF